MVSNSNGRVKLTLNLLPMIEAKQFAPLVGAIYVPCKSDTIVGFHCLR